MGKALLAEHMKESRPLTEDDAANAGPFIAISRQFGCHGFSMGLLLLEILNEGAEPEETWKIYHREILTRLATETNLAAEILDRERRAKPRCRSTFSGLWARSGYPAVSRFAIASRRSCAGWRPRGTRS